MGSIHIAVIPSRQGDMLYYPMLLTCSFFRKDGRVQKKTLADLSCLGDSAIQLPGGKFKGRPFVGVSRDTALVEIDPLNQPAYRKGARVLARGRP